MFKLLKKHKIGGQYIFTGLLNSIVHIGTGFVILRWLIPSELGLWQSFTVFTGYLQILTLGTTSGLNRDLPYLLGKGESELAIKKLKACGQFIKILSLSLIVIISLIGILLHILNVLSIQLSIMFIIACSIGAMQIQINFLGATFRSSHAFSKLSFIQMLNSGLFIILLPLVYFLGMWGYVLYQFLLIVFLFLGYYYFRPYKISYSYNLLELKELIKIGFPIYLWNYLSQISRLMPRTILVFFGTPLMVGLFSPASSINAAMLNLPAYTNRYLFPKMSYKYGQKSDTRIVYNYAIRAAKILLPIMFCSALILMIFIPTLFRNFFPKYIEGILPAQITLISGVFYSTNSIFHNALMSIKAFKAFRLLIGLRFIFIILFSSIFYLIYNQLLISVALGAVFAEMANSINYIFSLRKECL